MPPKKKRVEHDDSGLQQKCSRQEPQDCLLSAQTLASNFEGGASDSEADALDTQSDQDFLEHWHNERDFASDEEDDVHGIRSCLTFQDRYENHEDHAQRPFWVCLMVFIRSHFPIVGYMHSHAQQQASRSFFFLS
jgi:hypothetical protein